MKNDSKLQIVIIILLAIILSFLIIFKVDAINENATLQIRNQEMGKSGGNNPGQMGRNSSSIEYSAVTEITEDTTIENEKYLSESADENAILVTNGAEVTISNTTVNKTGDSDGGDDTSFYGINSGIIAKDKANLILRDITITTDATGANGVFSYGGSATTNNSSSDGTTVTISHSNITTMKDNSGGIMATGGRNIKCF